jgi:hypothetical protein
MTTPAGPRLGAHLTLIERLGAGGMAEVWLARDARCGALRVAKVLPEGADAAAVAGLAREWELMRRLDHPHVVRALEVETTVPRAFLVLEHVDGADVGVLRGRPAQEIAKTLLPIADALGHVHRSGVVHRDVKVANVLCDREGVPKLADFGVASLAGGADGLRGGGSPLTSSPQQLAGEAAHPGDDLYGFGALLYELITGRPPFWPRAAPARVLEEPPPPMRSTFPIPARLGALVGSLLAKSREERPADMGAVRAELEAVLREPAASPPSPPPSTPPVRIAPPPRLGAQRGTAPAREGIPQQRALRELTLAGFALLGLLALAVFFLLPRWVERSRTAPALERPASAAVPSPTPRAAASPGSGSAAARRAQDALERVRDLQGALLGRGVASWGGPEWGRASALLEAGDEALGRADHAVAAEQYETGLGLLEALEARVPQVLSRALQDGAAALEAGHAKAAARAFETALAVDPENAAARAGRRRAGVLDELRALLARAAEQERAGALGDALATYRKAVALDPDAAAPRAAAARIEAGFRSDAHSRALARALEAIERGAWADARRELGEAEAARPGDAQVAAALLRVEEGERRDAIARHRERAAALEAEERWAAAQGEYEAVLALDPTIRFAQEGRARSADRDRISEALIRHLASPERLSAPPVLGDADALLDEAARLPAPGPTHRAAVAALRELVAEYSTPVEVWLESDEQTDVTVYQVGRLGAFRRRSITLRPGRYTVVGSRRGYRDVRLELVVAVPETPPLVVRCEEPI